MTADSGHSMTTLKSIALSERNQTQKGMCSRILFIESTGIESWGREGRTNSEELQGNFSWGDGNVLCLGCGGYMNVYIDQNVPD